MHNRLALHGKASFLLPSVTERSGACDQKRVIMCACLCRLLRSSRPRWRVSSGCNRNARRKRCAARPDPSLVNGFDQQEATRTATQRFRTQISSRFWRSPTRGCTEGTRCAFSAIERCSPSETRGRTIPKQCCTQHRTPHQDLADTGRSRCAAGQAQESMPSAVGMGSWWSEAAQGAV